LVVLTTGRAIHNEAPVRWQAATQTGRRQERFLRWQDVQPSRRRIPVRLDGADLNRFRHEREFWREAPAKLNDIETDAEPTQVVCVGFDSARLSRAFDKPMALQIFSLRAPPSQRGSPGAA